MRTLLAAPPIRLMWGVLGLLLVIDQITKLAAVLFVPDSGLLLFGQSMGFFVELNQGVAFSIPLPTLLLLTAVAGIVAVLAWIHANAWRRHEAAVQWGSGLIIIGAVSNFIDRIWWGGVIDFLRILPWPTFNVADCFVLLGVGILLRYFIINETGYARKVNNSNLKRN